VVDACSERCASLLKLRTGMGLLCSITMSAVPLNNCVPVNTLVVPAAAMSGEAALLCGCGLWQLAHQSWEYKVRVVCSKQQQRTKVVSSCVHHALQM
jgi:hypothetical protein